jgi:hypothetical protein
MKPQDCIRESRKFARAWFAVPLSTVLAVVAVVVIISWPQSPGMLAKATTPAPALLSVSAGMREPSQLDLLRDSATLGDPIAGIALVSQLLDSFERTGRSDDLYEAVQWMDRGWADGYYQSSSLPTRVFERYCDYGALRWHWLCDLGE